MTKNNIDKLQNITILYLYSTLSPPENYEKIASLGGAEKRIFQLAVYFCETGAKVIVASDDSDKSLIIKNLRMSGVKCIRIPFSRKSPLSIIVSLWKLFLIFKNYNVQLIHSHHRWTTMLAFILSKLFKISMIHNARNIFNDKKIFGKFAGDNIIAVSESVKHNLMKCFGINPNKIKVIYNGIAIENPIEEKMQKKISEMNFFDNNEIISVIGRIAKQKGLRYLIGALPKVIQKFPTLKVLFIGEEDFGELGLKRLLQTQADNLGIGDNIEFLGYQEDIATFIGISKFTILPSLWEGLPSIIIESQLLGKPVIATNVGGTSEIITNTVNGILVKPKNPEMLANAIIYMLSNQDKVRRMGEMGKKMAKERFAVQRMLNEYSEYYLSLLSKRRY